MADKDKHGKFTKGNQAGTRSKRQASLATLIKRETKDGEELVKRLLKALKSKDITNKDMVSIVKLLLSYSHGQPTQYTVIEGDVKVAGEMSPEVEELIGKLNPSRSS